MRKPINEQLNVVFSAAVALIYLCLGIYLFMYPIDLGVGPYVFPSVIVIYGIFRAWRAYDQYKRNNQNEE
jgi:hypothetical protein